MTRYYPAQIHDDSHGKDVVMASYPRPSYAEATQVHADRLAKATAPASGYWRDAILLDLGSLPSDGDETAWKRLLNDDPVILAVFKLGVSIGHQDAASDET